MKSGMPQISNTKHMKPAFTEPDNSLLTELLFLWGHKDRLLTRDDKLKAHGNAKLYKYLAMHSYSL